MSLLCKYNLNSKCQNYKIDEKMNKTILVFLPNTLEKYKTGYLKGSYKKFGNYEAYYVLDEVVTNNSTQCIGYVGKTFKNSKCKTNAPLFINNTSNKIFVNNDTSGNNALLSIVYDYQGFKNSDIICRECNHYGKHLQFIAEELRKFSLDGNRNGRKSFVGSIFLSIIFLINFILKIINIVKPILRFSATFLHFEETTLNLRWFFKDVLEKKKLTPKAGNLLTAKIIDLLIGIILLNWCLQQEYNILNFIQTGIEDIITNLKGLLLYLMGSPIGLKLNHYFNNTLGKFFFYHISLWRIFLEGTYPVFRIYFRYLVLPGALGFSFQIAMFSDIASIATLHVYCIYVYAARLFSLQIRGLVSLWRLFMGKKLNPLRERVDSCRYTPDQLFIGTLGFTVLLFLLPTTTMYYAVFTTFRFLILLVNGLLLRARFLLNVLPLYVLALWIINSSSLAGTVYINLKNVGTEIVIVEAKLKALPLKSSIVKFVPDSIKFVEGKPHSHIFHSMFTGVLL